MKDWTGLDSKYLGGPFDRQVRIEDWSQDEVKKQSVLVLGVGGLGSAITINLLRLGVGKLFLVDYDVVDLHNMNRQLLYSHADVGKPKVEMACKNAQFHNAGATEIQSFHGNALTNWQKITDFAKRSTFVYNCIDWGDKFDMAVASLCMKLNLPLVMGGTFSTSLTIDYFPPSGRPCYLCTESIVAPPEFWQRVKPQIIVDLKDISFLPRNNNPIGRSSVVVCTICAQLMVSHFLNWLFLSSEKPYKASRLIFYHNTLEIIKFDLQKYLKCPFCSLPEDHIEAERLEKLKQEEQKLKQEEQKLKQEEQILMQKKQQLKQKKQKLKQENQKSANENIQNKEVKAETEKSIQPLNNETKVQQESHVSKDPTEVPLKTEEKLATQEIKE